MAFTERNINKEAFYQLDRDDLLGYHNTQEPRFHFYPPSSIIWEREDDHNLAHNLQTISRLVERSNGTNTGGYRDLSSFFNDWSSSLTIGSKGRYVSKLMQLSSSTVEETLKACLSKVSESIHEMEKATQIVKDGCFILGFLYSEKEEINGKKEDIGWVIENILMDMLRIENQIPFLALKKIFECFILKSKPSASLTDHIKPLLEFGHRCLFIGNLRIPDNFADTSDHDHILGLLHKCYQPKPTFPISSNTSKIYNAIELENTRSKILNVLELEKAGVSFGPIEDASWPMAIEIKYSRGFPRFWLTPTVQIPKLNIHACTEVFLQNMIEYERNSKVDQFFTSFVAAIDDLVDSGHDIATLVDSRVIINHLESNEEAANMINKIGKNALICNFYSKQWEELNAYGNRYTTLVRRKWNSLNLLGGIIYLLYTIKTYFAVNPRQL